MPIKLVLLLCLLVEGIALYLYNKSLVSPKYSNIIRIPAYIVSYSSLFLLHSFSDISGVIANILFFTIFNFLIIKFLYETNFVSAFIQTCLLTFLSIASETITGYLCNVIFLSHFWNYWNADTNLIALSFSVFIYALLLFCVALLQIRLRHKEISAKKEFVIILIICACITIVLTIGFTDLLIGDPAPKQINGILICLFLLMTILILVILLYIFMRKNSHINSLKLRQLQFEKDTLSLIEEIKNRETAQRILIHDIKNHLQSISCLSSDEKAVKEYISTLYSSPALVPTAKYCSNDFLNAILSKYSQTAKENEIEFNIETVNVYLDFISAYDMTVIFCNLLDNSIEAAIKCSNPYINITITSDTDKKISIIKISNSCQLTPNRNLSIVTTKPNPEMHGYGLISVKNVIEKVNGHMQQYTDDINQQHNTVVIFSWGFYENTNL